MPRTIISLLLTGLAALTAIACATGEKGLEGYQPSTFHSCNVTSQDKIEWDTYPHIFDGYLIMGGRTKDGARIHNPIAASNIGGGNWSAFNLNNLNESSGGKLDAVGNIYPRSMASLLASSSDPTLFADNSDYRVTDSEFYVKVKVPASLLNLNLAVVVWPTNPSFSSNALGVGCVVK